LSIGSKFPSESISEFFILVVEILFPSFAKVIGTTIISTGERLRSDS